MSETPERRAISEEAATGTPVPTGSPQPQPLAPTPTAIPVPVARPVPSRWGKRAVLVGIAVAALAVIAACLIVSAYSGRFLNNVASYGRMNLTSGPAVATWSADGRWIFAQYSDAMGSTSITAVRVSDGASRTIEGYWLVATEPTGSRARLVKDPGTSPFDMIGVSRTEASATIDALGSSVVCPGSYSDAPGAVSLVWDPSIMDEPDQSDWAAEQLPDGRTASFRIDPTRGVYPVAIDLFSAGVDLAVESTRTMQPLGWSASGRYYAALVLAPEQDIEEDEFLDRNVTVRVWDVQGRSEVASATFTPGIATKVVWSPVEDALYWTQQGDGADEPIHVTKALRPGAASRTIDLGSKIESASPVVVGTDGSGVLVRLMISDETTGASESSSATSPATRRQSRRYLRITEKGRVAPLASDAVPAIFCEVGAGGTLWWQPTVPGEDAVVSLSASGIDLWWARAFDAPATHLLNIELDDASATD